MERTALQSPWPSSLVKYVPEWHSSDRRPFFDFFTLSVIGSLKTLTYWTIVIEANAQCRQQSLLLNAK